MSDTLLLFLPATIGVDLSTKSLVVNISCSESVSQYSFLKGQKCFPLTREEMQHQLNLWFQAL